MRPLVRCLAVLAALAISQTQAFAVDWVHGSALTGEPRLAANFSHFPYVNPDAPKGGAARQAAAGSFDSFNPVIVKGETASGLVMPYRTYVFDSLMVSSLDELDIASEYGLLAEAMKYPDDFSSVTFRLNPKAKWHDGQPITVEDVIWSFHKETELNPLIKDAYRNVVKAEKSGEREVTFTFDVKGNRELPHIMGSLQVLPQHWWEAKDGKGAARNIAETTLEPPLGSGPYRIKSFEAGRFVVYERVRNYWGADLNVNVGTHNFDELRIDYYRDETVMMEAFKGDAFDYRLERVSRNWATAYTDLPARKNGTLILEEYPNKSTGRMQAFVPNLRRDKFKDMRVRRALDYAFDFETTNRTAFFGIYQRIESYFAGTELAASGLSSPEELALLEPLRGKIPDSVFTEPYVSPVGGDNDKMRANFREALKLLKEAGWSLKGNTLVNEKTGAPFTIEYLSQTSVDERFVLPFQANLERIGIKLDLRIVDSSAYQERIRKFDYDMIGVAWGQTLSPGNEQRNFWGTSSFKLEGSRNYAGISDPAIDALIDKVIFALDRQGLIIATKALDRVLMANHYVIPQWFSPFDRFVYWDRFGRPAKMPVFNFGFPDIWWYDAAKAARIK
jgi:microcin C transport system substrate-binding protein